MGRKRIDYIAKYAQRHRGPPPKRRTDFSNFLCPSSAFLSYSKSSPDSVLELSSYAKDGLVKSRRLFPCNELEDVGCDVSDIPPEMEPRLSQDVQDDIYMDRDVDKRNQEHDISSKSGDADTELMPLKAMWKPTVLNRNDRRDSPGLALKIPDRENVSDQLLTPSDCWNSPNSSEVDDESSERGRGKRRRRRPKIYLDESSSIAVKSSSKVRRLRIMRYLGLIAPVGSPF